MYSVSVSFVSIKNKNKNSKWMKVVEKSLSHFWNGNSTTQIGNRMRDVRSDSYVARSELLIVIIDSNSGQHKQRYIYIFISLSMCNGNENSTNNLTQLVFLLYLLSLLIFPFLERYEEE